MPPVAVVLFVEVEVEVVPVVAAPLLWVHSLVVVPVAVVGYSLEVVPTVVPPVGVPMVVVGVVAVKIAPGLDSPVLVVV